FDHHFGSELIPGQRPRVALGQHPDLIAVDPDPALAGLHLARKRAVVRVELEQVRDRLRVDQIVDPDPLDVGPALIGRAEHVAPDSPEYVDPDSYRHALVSPFCGYEKTKCRRRPPSASQGYPLSTGNHFDPEP